MNSLKDLIFRYCVLFGKRFSYREKIAFLRVISKELIQLGYYVDAKIAKLQLAKKKYENYYNAYIGDLDSADVIVCTYYDTGVNYFNLTKIFAFEQRFNKRRYFGGLIPVFMLLAIAISLNLFIFLPNIKASGIYSISGALAAIVTLSAFYIILKFKNGISNKKNFVCNTSSILVMLNTINKMNKYQKKRVAFVLYDGGCSNQYGLKMIEHYSDKLKKKKFIFLDSLGNSESLLFFKPKSFEFAAEHINFLDGKLETTLKKYLMITAGALNEYNQVQINNAHSRGDNILADSIIEKHSKSLHSLLTLFITPEKNKNLTDKVILDK